MGELLRHLRQAQYRLGGLGGQAHLQVEERGDYPIDDLGFGACRGDEGRLLQGQFHGFFVPRFKKPLKNSAFLSF